jgi:hypothetical protein
MAVKFSEFSPKQLITDVTEVVGYLQGSQLNVRIPPGNLDTTYVVSTINSGPTPAIKLQGTKPNQPAIVASTINLTGSGATLLNGNGSTSIDFASTTYALTATDTSPAGTVPLVLGKTGGGDLSGDNTVNLVGAGSVQLTATGNTITIDGFSAGDVESINLGVVDNSTGTPLVITGTGSGPYTGAVTIASKVYAGNNNIGIVPGGSGNVSSVFLNGTGTWTTPPNTITTVVAGIGVSVTGTSTSPEVNIDYAGADNAILRAGDATVAAADTIWFSDATDTTIKKGVVSDLPFSETLQEVCTAGNTTTTAILAGDGTVSLPSLAFTTEPDTGMYRSAANALALVTGGAAALTIDANQNATFNSTGATTLPVGDDAARPTPANGMIRYSTTANGFEGYINGAWGSIGGSTTRTKQAHTISGATETDLTLNVAPSPNTTAYVDLYISGVYQAAASYTISGTTLALVQSPGTVYFPQGSVVETIVQS